MAEAAEPDWEKEDEGFPVPPVEYFDKCLDILLVPFSEEEFSAKDPNGNPSNIKYIKYIKYGGILLYEHK